MVCVFWPLLPHRSSLARDWIWDTDATPAIAAAMPARSFNPLQLDQGLNPYLCSSCSWSLNWLCQSRNSHKSIFLFIYLFCFLGLHLRHMVVPRLGSIRATAASLHHSNAEFKLPLKTTPQLNSSAGFPTHRARPGIESASSWMLVGFVSSVP